MFSIVSLQQMWGKIFGLLLIVTMALYVGAGSGEHFLFTYYTGDDPTSFMNVILILLTVIIHYLMLALLTFAVVAGFLHATIETFQHRDDKGFYIVMYLVGFILVIVQQIILAHWMPGSWVDAHPILFIILGTFGFYAYRD